MATKFADVYNRFLGKITDDMYIEMTPEDTIKDLRNLLIEAIPGFEFPRFDTYDYTISEKIKYENKVLDTDFVIGSIWEETDNIMNDNEDDDAELMSPIPRVLVEYSEFKANLTSEEINILAILMMTAWLQRQTTSIENVRMKYSGSDFKMTS